MKLTLATFFALAFLVNPNQHASFVEFESDAYHVRVTSLTPFLTFDSTTKAFQFSQDEAPESNQLLMDFTIQNLHSDTLRFRTVKSSKGNCTINTPKVLAPNELKKGRVHLSTRYMRHVDLLSRSFFTCVLDTSSPLVWIWTYTPPNYTKKE